MKHFESCNNDSVVTINDTDRCLYLKHKISLKGVSISPQVIVYPSPVAPHTEPGVQYAIDHAPTGDVYHSTLHIPILQRATDERYVYAMSSNLPVKNISLEEMRHQQQTEAGLQWTNYLRIMFDTDSVAGIRNVTDAMEIYVFSDKIPTTNKYGMEIYDKDGNLTFNSNELIMRLALVIYKEYPDTFLSKEEYEIGNVQFTGIKKPGLSFTYPLAAIGAGKNYMHHNVEWTGGGVNITTTYQGSAGGTVRPGSNKVTQVLICELDGTQKVPAIERLVI